MKNVIMISMIMIMTALLCACGTSEARQSSGEQTTEAAENATARADAGQGEDANATAAQANTGYYGGRSYP